MAQKISYNIFRCVKKYLGLNQNKIRYKRRYNISLFFVNFKVKIFIFILKNQRIEEFILNSKNNLIKF